MTDAELNEKIVLLMGVHLPRIVRAVPGSYLPDFLDPTRLAELMDLANESMGHWQLRSSNEYEVKAHDIPVVFDRIRSHAIARAIVGYAEGEKPYCPVCGVLSEECDKHEQQ